MTEADEGLSLAIARRASELDPSALPPSRLAATQAHLLDCLGLIIAGRAHDRVKRASKTDDGPDPVVVLSLACGALGLDDFDEATRTHPGAVVVPALVVSAASREAPVPGLRLATALALAYDMMAWLGAALDARQMHPRGRHPSSVLGVPSVAFAAAWLAGLDERAAASALGLGCGFSFGLTQFDVREDVRALQTAEAASMGLRVARFAAAGFHAAGHAVEGPGGLLNGDTSRVLPIAAIGATPSAVEQVSFKPYPHFSDLHPVVAALVSACGGLPVDPGKVVSIHATLTERTASRLYVGPVGTVKEAKRSASFVLAFALRAMSPGGPDLQIPFTELDLADSRTTELAERVAVTIAPSDAGSVPDTSSVEVKFADGHTRVSSMRGYPGDGRDPALRWSLSDARARFDALTANVAGSEDAARAAVRLTDLLAMHDDIRENARTLVDAVSNGSFRQNG